MDYGSLIWRSWQLTWRHRFLWLLGLFAATSVGSCSPMGAGNAFGWRPGSVDFERFYTPSVVQAFQDANPWLSRNVAVIFIGVVALLLLVGLVLFVLSVAAQGGMAEATADLARGGSSTAGYAWGTGWRVFWRYLRLWLLLIGLGILVAVALAVVFGVVLALGMAITGPSRLVLAVLGGLLGTLTLLIAIPVAVVVSVVVAFAQRAIVVEGVGSWSALRVGYRLVRRDMRTSLVAWLLSLALSIAAAIAIVAAVALLLTALGSVGAGVYAAAGLSVALALYGALALVALVAGIWLLSGIANAFFWNYWTLTYLYLTGRVNAQLEPIRGIGDGG